MSGSGRRVFVIIAGPNGSGKSTFAERAAGTDVLFKQQPLNPDAFTVEALAEQPALTEDAANLVAVERIEKAVWRALAEGRSVVVETVLSSAKFFPIVAAAHARNYRIRLIFVAVATVERAIERVAARVRQGKHGVPENKIRSRWDRSHENLAKLIPLVDEVLVFSNEGQEPDLVGEKTEAKGPFVFRRQGILPTVDQVLLA